MRAVRPLDRRPAVVQVPVPEGEGVRVRIVSAGICGSDMHLMERGQTAVLGHEFAGVTEDGTAVAVEPVAPCGACARCRTGDYHLCVLGGDMVFGVGLDGGMAEWCVVPPSAITVLPPSLAPEDACLCEPMAVAVHGVRRAAVGRGDRAAVIGGGTIGLTALVAAQAAGAQVDVAARHRRQRDAADALGGGDLDADADYDVVVEAAGSPSALADALARCRAGGRVLMLGSYWGDPVAIEPAEFLRKEVTLVPARLYNVHDDARDFDVAAALLAARPEVAQQLITHRFPLSAAVEAFAVSANRASGAIKVVLEP